MKGDQNDHRREFFQKAGFQALIVTETMVRRQKKYVNHYQAIRKFYSSNGL